MFGPGHLVHTREFAARRRYRSGAAGEGGPDMLRMYAVEPSPTITGAKADHHWPVRAAEVQLIARDIAARLGVDVERPLISCPSFCLRLGSTGSAATPALGDLEEALASDLAEHRGRSIVIAGEYQPAAVHALALAMNDLLGNLGTTVELQPPAEARPEDKQRSLASLAEAMQRGQVDVLIILGGNPAYMAPADLHFAERLTAKNRHGQELVPFRLCLSAERNETAQRCHWHVPECHPLESWGDGRAFDGTATIIQPLISPLYDSKTSHEVAAVLSGRAGQTAYQLLIDYWQSYWEEHVRGTESEQVPVPFAAWWDRALHDGLIAGSAFAPASAQLREAWSRELPAAASVQLPDESQFEIVFRPDPSVYDGRFANNGWLQELPKPLTKLTWDNAALMSLRSAKRLGIPVESLLQGTHGTDVRAQQVPVVELEHAGRKVRAPVWIAPGHADDSITVFFGYGQQSERGIAHGLGYNAYHLWTTGHPHFSPDLRVRLTGDTYELACTQNHFRMEGREIIRQASVEQFHRHRDFAAARSISCGNRRRTCRTRSTRNTATISRSGAWPSICRPASAATRVSWPVKPRTTFP